MNGPRRTEIQRSSGVIGPPPRSAPEPTDPRYVATKLAKQAADRYTVSQKPPSPRYAGPMKPRTRGDVLRNGNGNGNNGNGNNGAVNGGGYSPPAVNGGAAQAAPAEFWKNPYYWAAVAALIWWLRSNKK